MTTIVNIQIITPHNLPEQKVVLGMIIYLGRTLPYTSGGSPSTTFINQNYFIYNFRQTKVVPGTALHTRKDLAVSPHTLPYGFAP